MTDARRLAVLLLLAVAVATGIWSGVQVHEWATEPDPAPATTPAPLGLPVLYAPR